MGRGRAHGCKRVAVLFRRIVKVDIQVSRLEEQEVEECMLPRVVGGWEEYLLGCVMCFKTINGKGD